MPDEILSWENTGGITQLSVDHGTKKEFLVVGFNACGKNNSYKIMLFGYSVDTFSSQNEGLFMLEVHELNYPGTWEPWQDRLRAGISIVK